MWKIFFWTDKHLPVQRDLVNYFFFSTPKNIHYLPSFATITSIFETRNKLTYNFCILAQSLIHPYLQLDLKSCKHIQLSAHVITTYIRFYFNPSKIYFLAIVQSTATGRLLPHQPPKHFPSIFRKTYEGSQYFKPKNYAIPNPSVTDSFFPDINARVFRPASYKFFYMDSSTSRRKEAPCAMFCFLGDLCANYKLTYS